MGTLSKDHLRTNATKEKKSTHPRGPHSHTPSCCADSNHKPDWPGQKICALVSSSEHISRVAIPACPRHMISVSSQGTKKWGTHLHEDPPSPMHSGCCGPIVLV